MHIRAVIFDFIGTTVIEKDPSGLNQCFVRAFKDHGVHIDTAVIKANRGKDKRELIEAILSQNDFAPHLAEPVLQSFRVHLVNSLDNFNENEGAADIIKYLRERKILVGLGSGLPRDIFEAIFDHVGWNGNLFDYIGIAEETGRGRPYPDMIFDMMRKLGLQTDELLKVGDTVADIQEGRNAKVRTAAILSGTQEEKEIMNSQPDFIIHSLAELKNILNDQRQE